MTEITVNIELYCAVCGNGICRNATPRTQRSGHGEDPTFDIEPCEVCLENARQEGHDKGHSEGHTEGYDAGYGDGLAEGEG